jgi:alkaline phosphatase D
MNLPQLDRRRATLAVVLGGTLAPAFVRHARAADVPRFTLGVASGQPRPDRLVLWTRLMGPDLTDQVAVQWELAQDEAFTTIAARGTFTAEAAWAHSVHAEPSGLAPDRWYWYRFTALGQRSTVGRTRTAPATDAQATLRFAIASCQRFDVAPFAAWRHLARQSLDAVMFLGDYIYESGSSNRALRPHTGGNVRTLEAYRERYAQYKGDPDLQAAHAACPWWLVWDDHEVENDYAAAQGQTLDPDFLARRAAAYQAYWEHMPFTLAQRPKHADMRIVDRFTWGRLATVHLLDDRQYRDPQACPGPGRGGSNTVRLADCEALKDPSRTLLGSAQEQWLSEGWDAQRPWNLVGQQTLMARVTWRAPATDPTYWTDGWDGYPVARQRLLDSLQQRAIKGAVVLGGDVHAHYVASLKANFDDPQSATIASEFCGTSITSRSMPQASVDAVVALNPHLHLGRSDKRGAVVFNVSAKTLRADLLAVDDVQNADSPVSTLASFVVEAGRPGPTIA